MLSYKDTPPPTLGHVISLDKKPDDKMLGREVSLPPELKWNQVVVEERNREGIKKRLVLAHTLKNGGGECLGAASGMGLMRSGIEPDLISLLTSFCLPIPKLVNYQ